MNKQKQSQSTHQKTESHESHNPQHSISIRKAAAKLKQKQAQLDIIKKRFLVLKGQQQYNRYRTMDQQRRIKQHNALHESLKKDRRSFQKQLMRLQDTQEKQLKQKHDKLKSEIKDNTGNALNSLMSSRVSDRNKLKQQTKINEDKIQENRKSMMEQNMRRKQSIVSEEKKQKMAVNQFRNSRISQTIGNRSMQASKLSQITDHKDKQLQKLMRYQQQLIKKASESVSMNQRIKGQFGKVFVDVKQKNYVKFPSISRQSGSYRTNHSTLSRNLSIYEI